LGEIFDFSPPDREAIWRRRIAHWAIYLGEIFDFSRPNREAIWRVLLSFERPACRRQLTWISIQSWRPAGRTSSRTLKTAQ